MALGALPHAIALHAAASAQPPGSVAVVAVHMKASRLRDLRASGLLTLTPQGGVVLFGLRPDVPLRNQLPFHALLHKCSDELTYDAQGYPQFSPRVAELRSFLAEHPSVICIDPLEATQQVISRTALAEVCRGLSSISISQSVHIPAAAAASHGPPCNAPPGKGADGCKHSPLGVPLGAPSTAGDLRAQVTVDARTGHGAAHYCVRAPRTVTVAWSPAERSGPIVDVARSTHPGGVVPDQQTLESDQQTQPGLAEGLVALAEAALAELGCSAPLLVKPVVACGTPDSHAMALVLPCLSQGPQAQPPGTQGAHTTDATATQQRPCSHRPPNAIEGPRVQAYAGNAAAGGSSSSSAAAGAAGAAGAGAGAAAAAGAAATRHTSGLARALARALGGVRLPAVVQEFVNHGGVVFKAYVAGDQVFCAQRPSIPDVLTGAPGASDMGGSVREEECAEEEAHRVLFFDSLRSLPLQLHHKHRSEGAAVPAVQHQLPAGQHQLPAPAGAATGCPPALGTATSTPPPTPVLEAIARYLSTTMRLSLYGFDVIVAQPTTTHAAVTAPRASASTTAAASAAAASAPSASEYLVIDINYLPHYRGVDGACHAFWDTVRRQALQQQGRD